MKRVSDILNRQMAFIKQAISLPTYLFPKPAQDRFSHLSCFIAFFSARQELSATFMRPGFHDMRVKHVRTPTSCPSGGTSGLMGRLHTEVHSPVAAAFIGFAAQVKPARFESAGAFALHTRPFGLNLGDASGTQEIRV